MKVEHAMPGETIDDMCKRLNVDLYTCPVHGHNCDWSRPANAVELHCAGQVRWAKKRSQSP